MVDYPTQGGPAFPSVRTGLQDETINLCGGMTLRDYFAGQALNAIGTWMPAHGGSDLGTKHAMQARALWAYEQADAMLAERKKATEA